MLSPSVAYGSCWTKTATYYMGGGDAERDACLVDAEHTFVLRDHEEPPEPMKGQKASKVRMAATLASRFNKNVHEANNGNKLLSRVIAAKQKKRTCAMPLPLRAYRINCPDEEMASRIVERGKGSGRADDHVEAAKVRIATYHQQSSG